MYLAACATGYKSEGFGGGFSEIPIAADAYQVSVRGNGYTSASRVQEIGLLRSAELAKENGFNYFVIHDMDSWTSTSQFTIPGSSTTTTTGSATAYGYGNTLNAFGQSTSHTTYNASQTMTFFKPNVAIVVQFVPDKVAEKVGALGVQQIYDLYAEKYGLDAE